MMKKEQDNFRHVTNRTITNDYNTISHISEPNKNLPWKSVRLKDN